MAVRRRFTLSSLAMGPLALSLLLCPGWTRAQATEPTIELVDAVVASVDGTPITLLDLERYANGVGKMLSVRERNDRALLLDSLVEMRLFEAEYEAQGITVDDRDVESYIDHIIREGGSSREKVQAVLDRLGLGWDDYFGRMRHEVRRLSLVNREIRARVNISPEQVERHWKEDPSFLEPARIEIADIFIPLPSRANPQQREAARARAKEAHLAAERNFAKAARTYSAGPTAEEGGVLGKFRRGTMAPAFEKELDKLSEGEVSEPFEAEGAIHILKVVRDVPQNRIPLEDVREQIEAKLYEEALDSRFKRWMEEDLRKRHHVTEQLDDLDELITRGST